MTRLLATYGRGQPPLPVYRFVADGFGFALRAWVTARRRRARSPLPPGNTSAAACRYLEPKTRAGAPRSSHLYTCYMRAQHGSADGLLAPYHRAYRVCLAVTRCVSSWHAALYENITIHLLSLSRRYRRRGSLWQAKTMRRAARCTFALYRARAALRSALSHARTPRAYRAARLPSCAGGWTAYNSCPSGITTLTFWRKEQNNAAYRCRGMTALSLQRAAA